MNEKLLPLIEDFLAEASISAFRFGILAVNNGRLVERLREGKRIWPDTEMRVRAYIVSQRSQPVRRRASASAKASEAA
jgi:hypothetical protein